MTDHRARIVSMGGGSGMSQVLRGLLDHAGEELEISAIVSMSDDGGSTAVFVNEYGMLPPGDIRQNLSHISTLPHVYELLEYRFTEGPFDGHPLGNFVVASAIQQWGVVDGIAELERVFSVPIQLIPGTLTPHTAIARVDQDEIRGQQTISYDPRFEHASTIELSTAPRVVANPDAVSAIRNADLVLIGPGNPYGTVYWNFVYEGMREALSNTHARVCLMANLMSAKHQFAEHTIAEQIRRLEQIAGTILTDVVYHENSISENILNLAKAHEAMITSFGDIPARVRRHPCDLLGDTTRFVSESDHLKDRRTVIRHDPAKSAVAILGLLDKIKES